MTAIVSQVDTHLAAALTNFVTVAPAWTTEPIDDFDAQAPACLYYLAGIQSEASPYDSGTHQPGERSVGILIACPLADFETRWAEVNAAMAGFQPAGGTFESFEHDSGGVIDISGNLIWWRDVYSVRCYRGEI